MVKAEQKAPQITRQKTTLKKRSDQDVIAVDHNKISLILKNDSVEEDTTAIPLKQLAIGEWPHQGHWITEEYTEPVERLSFWTSKCVCFEKCVRDREVYQLIFIRPDGSVVLKEAFQGTIRKEKSLKGFVHVPEKIYTFLKREETYFQYSQRNPTFETTYVEPVPSNYWCSYSAKTKKKRFERDFPSNTGKCRTRCNNKDNKDEKPLLYERSDRWKNLPVLRFDVVSWTDRYDKTKIGFVMEYKKTPYNGTGWKMDEARDDDETCVSSQISPCKLTFVRRVGGSGNYFKGGKNAYSYLPQNGMSGLFITRNIKVGDVVTYKKPGNLSIQKYIVKDIFCYGDNGIILEDYDKEYRCEKRNMSRTYFANMKDIKYA